jgi:hypothetical protein
VVVVRKLLAAPPAPSLPSSDSLAPCRHAWSQASLSVAEEQGGLGGERGGRIRTPILLRAAMEDPPTRYWRSGHADPPTRYWRRRRGAGVSPPVEQEAVVNDARCGGGAGEARDAPIV